MSGFVVEPSPSGARRKVPVWDLPTRLFKWTLVLLIALAWVSNRFGGATPAWHKWNGYAILILIVFRVLWGFVGGSTARFSSFVRSPRAAFVYLRDVVTGHARHFLGHNPAGAFMVLALMTVVAVQGVLGLYAGDEDRLIIEGPLAKTVADATVGRLTRLHHLGFDLILILAGIHVLAVLYYRIVKKEPLIEAMITGEKPAARYEDGQSATAGSAVAAWASLAVAAMLVLGGIVLLGGNPFR